MKTRAIRALACHVRRSPVTTAYITALLCVHWITDHALTPVDSAGVKRYVSTNLDNLQHHPVQSIVGSAFLVDGSLTHVFTLSFGGTLITFVLGIAIVLARLESRLGAARAYVVFTAGHIGATLIVAGLIAAAVAVGWYPEQVRSALDFGISYGSQAALGCATLTLVPRRFRIAWFLLVITWPLGGMSIVGRLPDFATLGHWVSAGIGLAGGYWLRDYNQANHPEEITLLPSAVPRALQCPSPTVRPSSAISRSPLNSAEAAATEAARSFPGQKWVSMSLRAPACRPQRPASAEVIRLRTGRLVSPGRSVASMMNRSASRPSSASAGSGPVSPE
jgi:hypothetical protein